MPAEGETGGEKSHPLAAAAGTAVGAGAGLLAAAAVATTGVVALVGFLRRVMLPVGLRGLSGKRISRCWPSHSWLYGVVGERKEQTRWSSPINVFKGLKVMYNIIFNPACLQLILADEGRLPSAGRAATVKVLSLRLVREIIKRLRSVTLNII